MALPGNLLGIPFIPEIDSRFYNTETVVNSNTTQIAQFNLGLNDFGLAANRQSVTGTAVSTISTSVPVTLFRTTGVGTTTLGAPLQDGQVKLIENLTTVGTNSLAMTNIHASLGTGSVISFITAGDSLLLYGINGKWMVIGVKATVA